MPSFKDLTGRRYGKLLVLETAGKDYRGAYLWRCKCDCGAVKVLRSDHLPKIKSCGCLRKEQLASGNLNRTHGESGTRLYRIWKGIKYRCADELDPDYGARGIRVCPEWESDYVSFRDWAMSNGYCETLTIDRIDNDGNYSPDNCRWANREIQNNNTRQNHWLTLHGRLHTIAQWSRITGITVSAIKHRLERGWPLQDVLMVPLRGSLPSGSLGERGV